MTINITDLPEDCISQILSLTSPKDVLVSSVVSKQFSSASVSDTVWDKFLPSDCNEIVSRSSSSIPYDQIVSKKDLFTYLTRVFILLDDSTKSFGLDKWNGKICYMLGARALSITWGSSPEYWSWESIPESRFPECAELKDVCWLHIQGKIHTTMLSPGTTYGTYFVFKIEADRGTGFENTPVEVSVSQVSDDGLPGGFEQALEIKQFYLNGLRSRRQTPPGELPIVRGDGWMEIEMGRCQVGVDRERRERVMLELTLEEIQKLNWKNGLVVHGIELRPLS